MFERREAVPPLIASHHDEVTNKNAESKQQLNRIFYADMITKMNCTLNNSNQFTGSVMISPIVTQNSEAKVEEYGTGSPLTLTTDVSSEYTLPITLELMDPEVKYVVTTSSAFPVNGTNRLIMTLPFSEAPVIHGKHSESLAQFCFAFKSMLS